MRDHKLRCLCGKMVCMIEGNEVQIKCSRCKRMVIVQTRGIVSIAFREGESGASPNIGAEQ